MADVYGNILELVEREIENIVRVGALDQNSLCNLDKLVDISKDIETIWAMRNSESGYFGMNYDDGYTYRSSRNNMGRYGEYNNRMYDSSSNGMNRYSMTGDKKHMLDLMYNAMEMASGEEREEIRKMIQKMENK